MNKMYHIVFLVDGRKTEQNVSAFSSLDAKKLIEAQYSGHKINFLSWLEAK